MPTISANDIDICYESYGPEDAPPVLLVMGLGAQMITWSTGFVSELLERGFRVVRFDNRDAGLSSRSTGPAPDLMELYGKVGAGDAVEAPYTLSLLAADAAGLLDALDIPAAHVVGASMGGMIVQTMAIEHPDKVLSLTSIMSTTGDPQVGQPSPDAMAALLAPAPANRDEAIEQGVKTTSVISGSLFDEDAARARAAESYDRANYPEGFRFQLAAILASGDRTERLRDVSVPTLVVHGREDPLVTLSGGEATAAAIPGADLVVFGQMGHDIPERYWPALADAIFNVAALGEGVL
jgi:pimeloyl-ACP methyl ester carboxylesterase